MGLAYPLHSPESHAQSQKSFDLALQSWLPVGLVGSHTSSPPQGFSVRELIGSVITTEFAAHQSLTLYKVPTVVLNKLLNCLPVGPEQGFPKSAVGSPSSRGPPGNVMVGNKTPLKGFSSPEE